MGKNLIIYDNKMNEFGLKTLSNSEAKLWWALASQLKDQEGRKLRLSRKEVNALSGEEKRHLTPKEWKFKMTKTCSKLMQLNTKIVDPNDGAFILFAIFPKLRITEEYIEFEVSDLFQPWFNQLTGNFTTFQLEMIASFNSLYTQEIYRRLMQWKTAHSWAEHKGHWTIDLNEFREQLGIPDNYTLKDIQRAVLDKAKKELVSESGPFSYLEINRILPEGKTRGCVALEFIFSEKGKKKSTKARDLSKLEAKAVKYENNFKNGYISGENSPANEFTNWLISSGIRDIDREYFDFRGSALEDIKALYKLRVLDATNTSWSDMRFLACIIHLIESDKAMKDWNLEDAYSAIRKKRTSPITIPEKFLGTLPDDKIEQLLEFVENGKVV